MIRTVYCYVYVDQQFSMCFQFQTCAHTIERVVQMAIFLLLSAAPKRILLYKIRCAMVQHSLSQPESFIVYQQRILQKFLVISCRIQG